MTSPKEETETSTFSEDPKYRLSVWTAEPLETHHVSNRFPADDSTMLERPDSVDASLDLQSFDWSLPVSQHETDAEQCSVVLRSLEEKTLKTPVLIRQA